MNDKQPLSIDRFSEEERKQIGSALRARANTLRVMASRRSDKESADSMKGNAQSDDELANRIDPK